MDLCGIEKKNQIGRGGEVKWVVREGIQRGTDNNNIGLLRCCMESLIQQKLLKYIPIYKGDLDEITR